MRRLASRAITVMSLAFAAADAAADTGGVRVHPESGRAAVEARAFHGRQPPAGQSIGGRFTVRDHHGLPLELGAPADRFTLVFFGFASCPSVCPTTLADARAIVDALGEDAPRVVFVTIDPERDTAAVLAGYVTAFHPGFIGASPPETVRRELLEQWRVAVRRHDGPSPGGHTFDHSAYLYLVDRDGRVRLLYPYATPAQAIVSDLRRLVRGP